MARSKRRSQSRRPRVLATIVAASASSASSSRRDLGLAAGLFGLPLVVMGLVGLAMRGYSDPVFTVGVLDQSRSVESRRLTELLDAEPTVRVRRYERRDDMRNSVYRGRLHAGLVIPPAWRGQSDLELYATAASVGAIVVRTLVDAEVAATLVPGARSVASRSHDGRPESDPLVGFRYTAPSNLVLFVMLTGMISSAGLLMNRRRGITRRLLATPARTWEIVLLLVVGPAQVMVVQSAFLLAMGALAFEVPWGDPLGIVALTAALVAVGVGLSLFMTSVFRTPEQAFSLAPLLGIAAGMLGGCMWPLSIVPPWLRQAGHALPNAWAMDGYLALIFGRVGASAILPEVGALLAMAAIFGTIGTLRLRTEMAAPG